MNVRSKLCYKWLICEDFPLIFCLTAEFLPGGVGGGRCTRILVRFSLVVRMKTEQAIID